MSGVDVLETLRDDAHHAYAERARWSGVSAAEDSYIKSSAAFSSISELIKAADVVANWTGATVGTPCYSRLRAALAAVRSTKEPT